MLTYTQVVVTNSDIYLRSITRNYHPQTNIVGSTYYTYLEAETAYQKCGGGGGGGGHEVGSLSYTHIFILNISCIVP